MSLFEDTNPKALKELLGEISTRAMALPDFQRDFVWEPGATRELIVSISNDYPAGSILRVRDEKRVFAAREFEGAPKLNGYKHTFLVLDGQQRLTSLYQAFFGVGDHRYYLDLKKLIDGADFDEAITYERAKTKRVEIRESFKYQASELILPLSVLKTGAGGFLEWMLRVTDTMPSGERTRKLNSLTKINTKWIRSIDEYRFPVVTLSPEAGAGALYTIFETLNRTGVKLSVFELLTARFWPLKINLRERWAEALSKYPIVEDFEVDPYYVLQAISLIVPNKAPSCKRGDVLELKPEDIERSWQAVITGLATGLDILREDCKVVLSKWLPYQTMLAPLAAVLAKVGLPKTATAGAHREKLKRWLWCAVFGQAYESSPNSQSAKDVTELVNWLGGGTLPDSVRTARFDPKTLRDVTPRQRSVYRGAICLILASGTGARDFHTGKVITSKLIKEEDIDDHHVFPSNFLEIKKHVKPSHLRDCVLNRTLIDRTTNHIISNRAPSDYFKIIRKTPNFPFEKVLDSHFLPSDKKSPLWTNNYETFLKWRERKLWEEIRRVTGMTEASIL